MIQFVDQPTPIKTLLETKRQKSIIHKATKIRFLGIEGYDGYNISQAFTHQHRTYIAARVEKRQSELSEIRMFEKVGDDIFELIDHCLCLMQDPFVTFGHDKILIGGTRIELDEQRRISNYYTEVYGGATLAELKPIFRAPDRMKDVRVMVDDGIHLFSRPQGGLCGPGKIGYRHFSSCQDISPQSISEAQVLHEHFIATEWGGVNQVLRLKNGLLGIVGHIAMMNGDQIRHYYGMVFAFDPQTKRSTKIKIICERSDFPDGPAKRNDLVDVVFLGGMNRLHNGYAEIYTGLSDCEAGYAVIHDPFLEWEQDR